MRESLRIWLLAALVPYQMYLVAYVFESRIPFKDVPVLRGQSKAFFPGDIGLAAFVASPGALAKAPSLRFRGGGVVLGVLALIAVRRLTYRPEDYTPQQWRSPSKVYHDVVVCMFFGYLAVTRCIPFYANTRLDERLARKLFGLAGLGVWIAGVVWDELHNEVPNNHQHPTRYWPIWKKPAAGPLSW